MTFPHNPSAGNGSEDWEDDVDFFAPRSGASDPAPSETFDTPETTPSASGSPFYLDDEEEDFDTPQFETNQEVAPLLPVASSDHEEEVASGPIGFADGEPAVPAPAPAPAVQFEPRTVLVPGNSNDEESASFGDADVPGWVQSAPVTQGTPVFDEEVQESIDALLDVIRSDDSSEVIMNGPNEVMMKRDGVRYHVHSIRFGDEKTYHRVINEALLPWTDTQDRIHENAFLVEGQLELPHPDGDNEPPTIARVHVIAPPVTRYAKVTIAKKSRYSYNLDDLSERGAMTRAMAEFLKATARGRITTVFSGLSGAGKTTFLEASSHYFDQNDRVVVVEDTKELRLPTADTVYLTTTAHKPGVKASETVTMEWLVRATNRMRPDRIIVGEVRGGEMSEFLVAANSGADGSMTTVHASDPRRTLDKMLSLAMRSEGAKNEYSVIRDIASTVQLIVQLGLIDGKHYVLAIQEVSSIVRQDSNTIATTPLFEYDRQVGRHVVRNRPSDELLAFLHQRGVEVNMAWFTR